mmetsp:Transcript_106048/g.295097  ORF Transcript_106048/g.295097 Transcript_106048/m.295097 type:complete len:216 (+) Transcript_106048:736-1383(+)
MLVLRRGPEEGGSPGRSGQGRRLLGAVEEVPLGRLEPAHPPGGLRQGQHSPDHHGQAQHAGDGPRLRARRDQEGVSRRLRHLQMGPRHDRVRQGREDGGPKEGGPEAGGEEPGGRHVLAPGEEGNAEDGAGQGGKAPRGPRRGKEEEGGPAEPVRDVLQTPRDRGEAHQRARRREDPLDRLVQASGGAVQQPHWRCPDLLGHHRLPRHLSQQVPE